MYQSSTKNRKLHPFIIVGYTYVFQPNPNRESCKISRYQPFIFKTTGYSDCVFLKSLCKSEGQITYTNGTTRSERKCACNTDRGFQFVINPKNRCFCNPFSEDCSCYIKTNPKNSTIDWKGEFELLPVFFLIYTVIKVCASLHAVFILWPHAALYTCLIPLNSEFV